jgi:predicted nucleic acid-binding protein
MLRILDASVAIKWFVPHEAGAAEAATILDQVRAAPGEFAVPELFFNEMLAVLVRLLGTDAEAVKLSLETLQGLGFERIGNGGELLARAAELAFEYGLSGYDAVYAACAQLTGACWLTADLRAHRKVEALKISRAVCQP